MLVAAAAEVNDGCSGNIVGVIGGQQDTCSVTVSATDQSIVEDADTEIIADAIAEACKADEDVVVDIDATATVCSPRAPPQRRSPITGRCRIYRSMQDIPRTPDLRLAQPGLDFLHCRNHPNVHAMCLVYYVVVSVFQIIRGDCMRILMS